MPAVVHAEVEVSLPTEDCAPKLHHGRDGAIRHSDQEVLTREPQVEQSDTLQNCVASTFASFGNPQPYLVAAHGWRDFDKVRGFANRERSRELHNNGTG